MSNIAIVANIQNLTPAAQESYLAGFFGVMEDLSWLRVSQGKRSIESTGMKPAPDYEPSVAGQEIPVRPGIEQDYKNTMTAERHGLRLGMDGDAIDKVDPAVLAENMRSVGWSGMRRIIESAYALIHTLTTTNRGDGVPVASTAHPNAVLGTQSNKGTSAFDNAAYTAGCLVLRQTQGVHGELLGLQPGVLLAPGALGETVYQVLGAQFSAADDRTKINYASTFGVRAIVSEFAGSLMGGSNLQWQIFAEEALIQGLLRVHITRAPAPIIERMPNTADTMQVIDEIRLETGTPRGWRGVYVSTGAGG